MSTSATETAPITSRLTEFFEQAVDARIGEMVSSGDLMDAQKSRELQSRLETQERAITSVRSERHALVERYTQMVTLFREMIPTLQRYSATAEVVEHYSPSREAVQMILEFLAQGRVPSEEEASDLVRSLILLEIPNIASAS